MCTECSVQRSNSIGISKCRYFVHFLIYLQGVLRINLSTGCPKNHFLQGVPRIKLSTGCPKNHFLQGVPRIKLSTRCPKKQSIYRVSQEAIYLQGVPTNNLSTGCPKNQSIYRVYQEAMSTFKVIVTYHEISKIWSDKKLDTLNTDRFESEYSLWTLLIFA